MALDNLTIQDGICEYHPWGPCSLVESVDHISLAIAICRERGVTKLLVNATRLVGMSIPTLVDRFLAAEEWAIKAQGLVVVALVIPIEYIHPTKFGVKVAADFGLIADVHTSEPDARRWIMRVDASHGPSRADLERR
jgi:hypothetical protein